MSCSLISTSSRAAPVSGSVRASVRACAALALGRQGDASRLPGLLVDDRARVRAAAALALAAKLSCAQSVATGPLDVLPYTPGLDLSAMDRGTDPCADFYQHVCGGWVQHNPIPQDQAKWDVYRKLSQANQRYLWGILDKLAQAPQGADTRTASQAKIGD